MNYWRMAFRDRSGGGRGHEWWDYCRKEGIAVICYHDDKDRCITGDCRKLTEEEYDEKWRKGKGKNCSGQGSLKKFVYRMKPGDVIYVKQGPYIVGKGAIGKYCHDEHKKFPKWCHYRKVNWEKDFPPFRRVLGADQCTVLELEGKRLDKIREAESRARKKFKEHCKEVNRREAKEGQEYTKEATFRARNRALIEAKKSNSDYRCEVCKMSYKEVYGDIGKEHIIAHHKNPIGGRTRASETTHDDLALVCSNCHDMLHRKKPPMKISELCRIVKPFFPRKR